MNIVLILLRREPALMTSPSNVPMVNCVAVASECETCGDGETIPDDSQVLTCRYESSFIDDNCADFPIDQGWTTAEVETFCKGQDGADASTVVVTPVTAV